jgi:hypothetical protein
MPRQLIETFAKPHRLKVTEERRSVGDVQWRSYPHGKNLCGLLLAGVHRRRTPRGRSH